MKHTLLDITTAAERIGITTKAVYAAIGRQSLPRRYSRGNLIVREAELLAWHTAKPKVGRPKGLKMSAEAKQRISAANRKRWASRKADTTKSDKSS